MIHETDNLTLDEDGDVWLRFEDEDSASRKVGHVDDGELDCDDDDLQDEFLELQSAWRGMICDRRSYEAGIGSFWGR